LRRAALTAGGIAAAAAPVAGLLMWHAQSTTVNWYGDDFIMAQRALRRTRQRPRISVAPAGLPDPVGGCPVALTPGGGRREFRESQDSPPIVPENRQRRRIAGRHQVRRDGMR